MNEIKKIVIKSNLKLTEGAKIKSTFVIKDNYIFYETYTDNPNDSMFVADFYDTFKYKVNSSFFKQNFINICKEINSIDKLDNLNVNKTLKYTVTIYYGDCSTKRLIFYNTLEENALNELSKLFKCSIAPCECYPQWLETKEI